MFKYERAFTVLSWVISIIAIVIVAMIIMVPVQAAKVTWVDGKPVIEGPSAPIQGCFNGGFQIEVAPDCSKPDSNESK